MIDLYSSILNICNYEYNYFFNKANVLGVGLSYKIINGYTTAIKCIRVMVSKKLSKNLLCSKNLIPTMYKGIRTDVVEIGKPKMTSLTQRIRPVLGGYSIGPVDTDSAGSYGGLVKDANGLYILCNNHVLTYNHTVPRGADILQPAPIDGGSSPNDTVANLTRYIPLNVTTPIVTPENYVDCAIAKITNINFVSPYIAFIGIPTGIATPLLNMELQMAGSTSEYISASISALGVTIEITSPEGDEYLFKNQIIISHGCQQGDSGSLALTNKKQVVGLVFGGNNTETFLNPIRTVLQALNVSLVTI